MVYTNKDIETKEQIKDKVTTPKSKPNERTGQREVFKGHGFPAVKS
jgi:hypothetical protein